MMRAAAHLGAGVLAAYGLFGAAILIGGGWSDLTLGGRDIAGGAFYLAGMALSVSVVGAMIAGALWVFARGHFVARWWAGLALSCLIFLPVIYTTI